MTQRIFALEEPALEPELERAEALASDNVPKEEFELVVGRRQFAALAFLALAVVAVCSGGSYLAGKAISARQEPAAPVINIEQARGFLPVSLPVQAAAPMPEATIVPPVQARLATGAGSLFADPVPNAIYIQVGAVDKGIAIVIAEGLRTHALDSFVTRGPGEKAFCVLIGPFPNAEAYQKARSIVDQIGLTNFARRYQPK